MKKIDKLLINSFVPPFIVTFFIALFVLIMQFLWTYIDDIIGKGAGFLIILELLSYLSISLIPTALPIAVLISSVMVMGNLAERYELASIKSAGVPLMRIMRPLMYVTMGITCFSFLCSNYLIPLANLQFKSRLYDIRKQKPTLNLETGVFNDDFKGFIIHIGKKHKNNRDIEDIIIYDHSASNKEPLQVVAKRGEMFNTRDGNYFVMNLFDGTQYQETKRTNNGKEKTYPFVRTSFKQWNKVFDLSEFDINRTDTELFDDHYTMLSVAQLRVKIDSLEFKISDKLNKLEDHTDQYISIFAKEVESETDSLENKEDNLIAVEGQTPTIDTAEKKIVVEQPATNENSIKKIDPKAITESSKKHKEAKRVKKRKHQEQKIDKPLNEYQTLAEIFPKKQVRQNLISKAQSYARNMQSQSKSTKRSVDKYKEGLVKHIFELNIKFSMALVCFIFLFIGAPMGAIIRKGGFGYPLLVAIIFFMVYIVLNVFCKKLAESMVIPAELAAWIPCAILFPIGLLLTNKAMNDSKLLDIDKYFAFFRKWWLGKSAENS